MSNTLTSGPANPDKDSTVVTIGEVDYPASDGIDKEPHVKIVEHYRWTGANHTELYRQLTDILGAVWHCRRIVIDATGIGQPVASFLKKALGHRVTPFTFSSASKSELGFRLLAMVNSGRIKMYAGDGSPEYSEFCLQVDMAKRQYRPNRTINFFVDPSRGHDDFMMSLALLCEAAKKISPRTARGSA